jgi:hypothetical protein
MKIALVANDFSACRVKIWRLACQLFGYTAVDLYMLNPIQAQTGLEAEKCHRWTRNNLDQLAREVKTHDVIHVFCDATDLAAKLLQLIPDRNIIVHRHDISSLRGVDDPTEPWVMAHPNTLIVVTSPDHGQWLQRFCPDKTIHFIPNYPLRSECDGDIIGKAKQPRINGVMYYGGLVSDPGTTGTGYRFYGPQWSVLCRAGIDVHVYPKRAKLEELSRVYWLLPGCILHPPVAADEIVPILAQYEVSFIGYNDHGVDPIKHDYAMSCWPNKAFDPIAASTPLLGYRAGSTASLWHGVWGVEVERDQDLVEAYHAARNLKPDWAALRESHTLDQFIPTLTALYRSSADSLH